MFGNSFSKTSIQEANKHVQELMKRINELEERNRTLESTVEERDRQFQTTLTELSRRFESEIHEIQQQLCDADRQIERQHQMCEEKDAVIGELRRRAALLDRIVPHAAALSEVARIVERAKRSYDTVNVGANGETEFILSDSEQHPALINGSFKQNLARTVYTSNLIATDKFSIDDASASADEDY